MTPRGVKDIVEKNWQADADLNTGNAFHKVLAKLENVWFNSSLSSYG